MLRHVFKEEQLLIVQMSVLKPHRQITRELSTERIEIHHQRMRGLSVWVCGLGKISATRYAVIEARGAWEALCGGL